MYLSAFPQLIAGPIVRYVEIKDHITNRPTSMDMIFDGSVRFCNGLAKKVILADTFAKVSDYCFALPATEITMPVAWLGVLTYSFQIFFDFSAYSDMAIGIGKCMGFYFPENFNNPYRAQNITEFWRRWHMTLSRWFRDYLYIPLGGNRFGAIRTYINLFTVFILCGLWHGASYNFLCWGLYHGFLLTVERILFSNFALQTRGFPGQLLTFLLVLIGWAIFRCDSMGAFGVFVSSMFSPELSIRSDNIANGANVRELLTNDVLFIYVIAAVYILVADNRYFINRLFDNTWIRGAAAIVLLVIASSSIAGNDFHPFIYFRF